MVNEGLLDMCTRRADPPDWTLDDVLHNVLGRQRQLAPTTTAAWSG